MKQSPNIICLMGPTATGKTDLAIALSKQLPCDIISVDSAMVYQGMDIGSAKPSAKILEEAPHRLINICDPSIPYSAAEFREDAIREIEAILANNRIPLLVGGTMLYFKVLQEGISDLPSADQAVRNKLLQEAEENGWEFLHQKLQQVDPISAKRIHPNDPQRLQRALEVYEITGKSLTVHWQQQEKTKLPYRFINIALDLDRAILHERIEARFDVMIKNGFIDEVKSLCAREDISPDLPSMKSVGYQQAWKYLAGEYTLEEMREKAIVATRRLAKRQFTWLRSWEDVQWFDVLSSKLISEVVEQINGSQSKL